MSLTIKGGAKIDAKPMFHEMALSEQFLGKMEIIEECEKVEMKNGM